MGCKLEINTFMERYTHVEDFNCQTKEGESWWHLRCFGRAMNRDLTEMEKQAIGILSKASKIFENLPEEFQEKEKEYII